MMSIENISVMAADQPAAGGEAMMGRMLVDAGKITAADANRIVALQAQQGLRFGEAAKQLGLVTDADIRSVLASQFNYQYVQSSPSKLDPRLLAAFDPFGEEAEALRALREQLDATWFSGGRKALAVIAIDNDASADLLAANLAIVFAQQGQRTLLVDANMRDPRQDKLLHVTAKRGLSDALAGRAPDVELAPVAPFESLSLLSAGPPPPNPQELLALPGFGTLNDKLAQDFDVVLYAAPAFSSAADAYTIATRAGGVILVVGKSKTHHSAIRTVQSQLARRGVQIIGSILVDF